MLLSNAGRLAHLAVRGGAMFADAEAPSPHFVLNYVVAKSKTEAKNKHAFEGLKICKAVESLRALLAAAVSFVELGQPRMHKVALQSNCM